MEKMKIAGSSFLSNLQNKRFELEETKILQLESSVGSEKIDIEILAKSIDEEIDMKEYLDKPIEFLIEDSTEAEFIENELENEMKFYLEEKNQNAIDIEFVDIFEEENLEGEIDKFNQKNIFEEENEQILLLKSLQEKINDIQIKLNEKDKEIIDLKKENKGLQQTLTREQDIVMKEQDLHDKTLSRVEQLLLEKRTELIERQKASKKSWFLKLIDKVKA